jgi:hypothetical protein
MSTWREEVLNQIRILTQEKKDLCFTRQEFIENRLSLVEKAINVKGETPSQTLSRVLQELRDENILEFVNNNGLYYFIGDEIQAEENDLPDQVLDKAIENKKLRFDVIETGETSRQTLQRKGQSHLRQLTLQNYGFQCALCDVSKYDLLVASHVARWADCPQGRGDLANVICLCRWHDPLLEYGLLSLTDEHQLLKKDANSKFLEQLLQSTNTYREPRKVPLDPVYLALHRERTGFS